MIANVKGETYEERLKDAGLTTLKERRLRGDMIETYKTMKGMNRVERSKWFDVMKEEEMRHTRGNATVTGDKQMISKKENIKEKKLNKETRRNFFTVRVAKPWNSLPEEVKEVTTVNAFKNRLDTFMKQNKLKDPQRNEERQEMNS